MLEFNKIINPKTNRKVNIDSKLGQSILRDMSDRSEESELEELRRIAKRAEARKNQAYSYS